MTTKKCFKCLIEWPLIYFYKHHGMKDGHLNKCKKCCKDETSTNRKLKEEYYLEYDKRRAKIPARKKHITENTKKWRAKNPEKYKAQNKLNNALRDGKIKKQPCCVCGEINVHAHHEDYTQPLNVMWLCAKHHHNL